MKEKQANLFTTHPTLCIQCHRDVRTLGGGVWQGQGQFKCHPCSQPKLTVGSLFSGIGGFELGFERAGFEVAWQVEIDPWCRRVLTKHWPNVPKYEDVREVGKHNLAPVDVLIGGFPCQDLSFAGKGAGIDGHRSGLWSEYARIIGELRPGHVVIENVPALLHRGLERVLASLAAVGYDAEWDCLPAVAFGAPHIRDRVFVCAYPQRVNASERYFSRRFSPAWRKARLGQFDGMDGATSWGEAIRRLGRTDNGLPSEVDRLGGLGNAVVPAVAQYVAECVLAHAQASTAPQVAA